MSAGEEWRSRMFDARRHITARLVTPGVWAAKGYPLTRRLAEFRAHQFDDRATFERRRDGLLAELLSYALASVPFYRDRVSGVTPGSVARDPMAALESFPVLEKSDLREHRDELVVDAGRRSFESSSGGSTGEPVRFVLDTVYHCDALASYELFYEWAGVLAGERRLKLWGAHRDAGGGLRGKLSEFLGSRLTLDAFDMGPDEMREHLRAIAGFRPVCLEGYADALYALASFAEGESVWSPRAVMSSASTLHPHMRAAIGDAFGAPVFDRYGAREIASVACECGAHEGLHVFGETCLVEVVRDDGTPAPPGEDGELIVTSLTNYTMPFIRYRIGDRGSLCDRACSCGRPYPLLERISGRSDATFVRPDGGRVVPEFFIHLIGVDCNDGTVERFQVVQRGPLEISVRVVARGGVAAPGPECRARIEAGIRDAMGARCEVSFEQVDAIEPTPTGKHAYTVRAFQDAAARP